MIRWQCGRPKDETMPAPLTSTITERIESWSIPVTECGCWIWTKSLMKSGYGSITIGRKTFLAHRVSWECARGPVPEDKCVLHRCDVRACVNPDHLFLGTKADNHADMVAKGRAKPAKGENAGNAKLTDQDVREIRLSTDTHRKIAEQFGIAHSGVTRIKNRKIWAHIQ